jgi:hypothetical protein
MAGNAGSAYHSGGDNDNIAARLLSVTSINYYLWITSQTFIGLLAISRVYSVHHRSDEEG